MGAIFRNKYVVDDDVMAAGALQPESVPSIFTNRIIAARQQEGAHVGRARTRNVIRPHQRAEQDPAAMHRTGGKTPMAGEAEAALDSLYLADRLISGRHQHGGILAPHLSLRLVMEKRHFIGVATKHAIHPACGHAAFGQCLLNIEKHIGVHFETTPAFGLKNAEKTRLLHFSDRFDRDIALRDTLFGARLQCRNHGLCTSDKLFGRRNGHRTVLHGDNRCHLRFSRSLSTQTILRSDIRKFFCHSIRKSSIEKRFHFRYE